MKFDLNFKEAVGHLSVAFQLNRNSERIPPSDSTWTTDLVVGNEWNRPRHWTTWPASP
jgi:hypothetical protein